MVEFKESPRAQYDLDCDVFPFMQLGQEDFVDMFNMNRCTDVSTAILDDLSLTLHEDENDLFL